MLGKFQFDGFGGVGGAAVCVTYATLQTVRVRLHSYPMKFFAFTYTYGDDTQLVDETRPAHREFIASQLALGRIVGSGPYVDGSQALIIIQLPESASLADATGIMDKDPYVAAGALKARDVHEWNPVSNIFAPGQ